MFEPEGSERTAVIGALADAVVSIQRGHPIRVAVDGWSCSGKTSVADELAAVIEDRGRPTLRASIDAFHCKGYRERSARGEWTPERYYDEGYDFDVFRAWVLEPLGPGGNRRCRTSLRTTWNDEETADIWQEVSKDAAVIVDGSLLLHPLLSAHWDFVIWLDVDLETMVERACQRDGAWYGSREAADWRYRHFRQPISEHYERLAQPSRHAHAILDNRVIERPRLLRLERPNGT